jgi:hypothetical protein
MPQQEPRQVTDWIALVLLFLLDLASKPTFWVCVSILWAAGILASSIDKSARIVGRQLELLARRFRKRPASEDDELEEDDFFDDDL